MKKATQYLSWFSFLFVCGIALLISCSDNGGSSQQSSIEITRISPDSGAVGSRVRIYSSAIDPEHANNQVELDGIDVPILSYGSGSLAFEVPEGAASGPVTLRVNGKVANGPYFKVLTEGPVIEGISPVSGGPGTQVTITGEHFLPSAMMAKVSGDTTDTTLATDDSLQAGAPEVTLKAKGQPSPTINGLPVSVSFGKELAPLLSLSATEVIAQVPEGATDGLITLSVDGQTVTSEAFRLMRGPMISEVNPTAGPAGTTVTISGHHFVAHPDSNRVTVNGRPAPVTEADSARLVATIPEGATTGPVEVTTRDQTAEGPTFTVTEAPVPQVSISNIIPKTGPVGTEVTITGENFSSSKAENTITFNGTEATISSASKTMFKVKVPQDATSGPVKVKTNGQTATGPTFTVSEEPVPQVTISDMSPKTGPVGTAVTITGQNFSPDKAENTVTFNGTQASVSSASETSLEVTVPEGATNGPVKVEVNGQTGTGPSFSVTADPDKQLAIKNISPKEGPVGTNVTISGANFSSTASENIVTFNGTEASVQAASTTELTVTVPEGATTGAVKVAVGSQIAEGPTFTVTEEPVPQVSIEDIAPKEGPVGTDVTITGQNFSATPSENVVTFNGTKATLQSATETKLVASVPQGATDGSVKVQVNGQTATGPSFSVTADPDKQLAISDITPKEGLIGTSVTITGANFSSTASENMVTFNGTEASVQAASTNELTVTVPEGATTGAVKVAVGSQTAEGPTFTVTEAPVPQVTIDDISPKEGTVGTSVTITGQNFSGTVSENTVTFNGTEATVSSASTSQLVATVPNGATSGPVQVSVGSQTATGPTFTVEDNTAPTITGEGSFEIEENTTAVATITASDADGDDLTFSLSGGADGDTFSIGSESGELTFTTATDFENPADADGNNAYEVEVKVSDGVLSVTKMITVSVTNVNDNPPTITSGASFTVDENTTAVATITASDPDGDDLAFSINGGADQGQFSIDASSGALTFTSAPDFEYPEFLGLDNTYEVTVQASDGNQSATKDITVDVQNVAEEPAFSEGIIKTNDNKLYYAYNTDFTFEPVPAGTKLSGNGIQYFNISLQQFFDPITNASISGPDAGSFSVGLIDSYGYTISLSGPTLAYSDSPYEFTVTAENAAGQTTTQTFTIPVLPFAGGSGTESDPYQVETVEQLQAIDDSQYLDAHFVQTADIDAAATAGWNGGDGFKPIGDETNTFTGSYEGYGHVITNLTINRTTTKYVGLFGYVGGAGAIKEVHTTNGNITGSGIYESGTGGLVGINEGTITGCSTGGTISASNTNSNVGGLVGYSEGAAASITNSYSTGSVNGAASGGLVGKKYNGTIETSYATGAVSGGTTGGLVGLGAGAVTDSYWDTQSTGQSTSAGGTGLTTTEMQGSNAETNMTGFDFTNVWQTTAGDYPTLRDNPE